jgi:23S rRNA G2445 N2-methylase RlmL
MFCGSGTILLEWADHCRELAAAAAAANAQISGQQAKELEPLQIEAVGLDVSLGAVQGAMKNAEAEGVSGMCTFR